MKILGNSMVRRVTSFVQVLYYHMTWINYCCFLVLSNVILMTRVIIFFIHCVPITSSQPLLVIIMTSYVFGT